MKFTSISKRLAVQIAVLMMSFSVILLISNLILLKPLYDYSIKKNMLEGAKAIQGMDFTSGQWKDELTTVDPSHAYDITVVSGNRIIYSSSMEFGIKSAEEGSRTDNSQESGPDGADRGDKAKRDKQMLPLEKVRKWETVSEGIEAGLLNAPDKGTDLYIMTVRVNEDIEVHLTQGVEPIRQSVYQANVLLGIVTFLFLLIALIVANRISKNFTKPIRDMKNHLNKLSRLDFSQTIEVDTEDELKDLSNNINLLSHELKASLEKLKEQNMQLEKDIEFQRKFISNASHELRTPLSLIKGYSEEIDKGYVKNRDQEQLYVSYIAEEATKMNRLLNELLELSRLESGYLELKAEPLNVKESIQAFTQKYTGYIEDHKLDIVLDLEECTALFDPVRFEQILANYLSNAAKYSNDKKEIKIGSSLIGETVRISVTNFGGPIDDKAAEHIWEGFYKADNARTYTEGSYGLGLSIVKAIQDRAGYKYGFYNGDNTVTFWFEIGLQ